MEGGEIPAVEISLKVEKPVEMQKCTTLKIGDLIFVGHAKYGDDNFNFWRFFTGFKETI